MEETLERLYTCYYHDVLRYVRRRTDQATAEEIAAEVFCAALVQLRRDSTATLSVGWLMTVAKRRLADHWRRADRARRFSHLLVARDHDPMLLAVDVNAVLQELTPRQRVALRLRYLDDQPVGVVAAQLDCSYQGAESLLARGRRNFAESYVAVSSG